MDAGVERRKAVIINIVYYALILVLFFLFFKMAFPLLLPFVVAFAAAGILNRPVSFLSEKTKIKRSFLSVVSVLLLLSVFFGVFFLIIMSLVEKIKGFSQFLLSKFQDIGTLVNDIKLWILSVTDFLPEAIKSVLHENITLFFDSITKDGLGSIPVDALNIDWGSLLSKGGQMLTGTVAHIPAFLITCVVSVISCVFIVSDYGKIKNFFVSQVPEGKLRHMSDAWHLGVASLKKMLKAYCLILFITFSELSLGLYILKWTGVFSSPYIFLIALIIAIIDIVPVLGTGTILIPWAVYSLLTGSVPLGIGLIIIYAVILVVRQIIEPKLVAGQVGLPPIVTLIAMYIGTKTLGVLGFFILPFSIILVKVFNDAGLIHIFKKNFGTGKGDAENSVRAKEEEPRRTENAEQTEQTEQAGQAERERGPVEE